MIRCARVLPVVLGLFAVSFHALPASADPASEQACRAAQLAADGKACKMVAGCYAKAAAASTNVDSLCIDKAGVKMGLAYGKAETIPANCTISGKSTQVFADLKNGVASVASSLNYTTGGKCSSKKLKAAGKKCAAILKCYATAAAAAPPPVVADTTCTGDASGKFDEAFTKIDTALACTPSGNAGTIENGVDAAISTLVLDSNTTTTESVSPTTSSSTSTTMGPSPCIGVWHGIYGAQLYYDGNPSGTTTGTLNAIIDAAGVMSGYIHDQYTNSDRNLNGTVDNDGNVDGGGDGFTFTGTADCSAGTGGGSVTIIFPGGGGIGPWCANRHPMDPPTSCFPPPSSTTTSTTSTSTTMP